MKKQLRTFALKSCLTYSSQPERCTQMDDLHYGEPVNDARVQEIVLVPLRHMTPAIQDLIQSKLHGLLGKGYQVSLFGSEAAEGAMYYHLQISHEPTGLCLEQRERIDPGFIEDIFILATQMKAMLDQRTTLERMGGSGQIRLLTWISDNIDPALFNSCQQAQRACQQALWQMQAAD